MLYGLTPLLEAVGHAIWAVFALQFSLELSIAPYQRYACAAREHGSARFRLRGAANSRRYHLRIFADSCSTAADEPHSSRESPN
jgi:hypothetical protein